MGTRANFTLALLICASAASGESKLEKQSQYLQLILFSSDGCDREYYAEQQPDPVFRDAKIKKTHGRTRLKQGNKYIDTFPDEISFTVYDRQPVGFGLEIRQTDPASRQNTCVPFDRKNVKFAATWANSASTRAAAGVVKHSEAHGPDPMCEMSCSIYWTYDVSIESKDIPITDKIVIDVLSADGSLIAKLAGGFAAEK